MAYRRNNVSTVSLRIADHIVIVVPHRPQINVIRAQEPGDDMSGRINNILNVYVTSHGAILTAVFSVQGPIGSEIWRSILILSGVISAAITIVLLRIFFQQFSLMRAERGLRDSLVENSTWVAQRAAFVLMIMGLSICLFFIYSRLLFARLP